MSDVARDVRPALRLGESLFVDFEEVTVGFDDWGDRDVVLLCGVCQICRQRVTASSPRTLVDHAREHVEATPLRERS